MPPPLLLVLVPLSLLQTLWGLLPLPGADPARVINGVLVRSPAGWLEVLVVAVAWTWAVTAGVAAIGGANRPLRLALRRLPTVCGALFAGVAAVLIAFLLVGLVLPAGVEVIWVAAVLLAVPVTVLLVRLALVLPLAVFEDLRGMAAFRAASSGVGQYMVSIAILFLLGVLGPALLTGWAWDRAGTTVDGRLPGLGLWLAREVVLVLLAALQAGTFVVAYRNLPQPRLTVVPSGPGDEEPRSLRPALVLGLAAVLLPMLVAGGVVATSRLPELSVRPRADPAPLLALGWPAGRHPVLLTGFAVEDCLDDQCRSTTRTGVPFSVRSPDRAMITADGSVYVLTGDRLAYCDPQRTCRKAEDPLEALGGDRDAAMALALAPDGSVLIAVAAPRSYPESVGQLRQEDSELRLIRCGDFHCTAPVVTPLGVVEGQFADRSSAYYRRLSLAVDRTGRPVVAYRPAGGWMVWLARCDTPACATAQFGLQAESAAPGLPTEDELGALHFDRLVRPCAGCTSELSATADRPGGGVYGVAIKAGAPGVRVHVGEEAPGPRRAVLWTCVDYRCRSPREVPLTDAALPEWSGDFLGPSAGDAFLLAVNPDGRVIVVRQQVPDQIVTVRL